VGGGPGGNESIEEQDPGIIGAAREELFDPLQGPGPGGPAGAGAGTDLVFKRPKGNAGRASGGGAGFGGFNPVEGGPANGPLGNMMGGFGGGGGLGGSGGGGGFGGSGGGGGLGGNQGGTGFGGSGGGGGFGGNGFGRSAGRPQGPNETVKIVALKRSKAVEAARVTEQLYGGQVTIAVDESANSIVLKGNEKAMEEIIALLAKLDDLDRNESSRGAVKK
jgi:hypothetical protein